MRVARAKDFVVPESGTITFPTFPVLGMSICPLQIPQVLQIFDQWVRERSQCHYVVQMGMHGASEALMNPRLWEIMAQADLRTMDGTPMRWLARMHGFGYARRRVYGPELMDTLLRSGPKYRHYFYGNRAADRLAVLCRKKYGTQVVGTYSLPIWPLPEREKAKIAQAIEAAAPDFVWVGLGTPRQDQWMAEFKNRLSVPVLVGVGAAYDFLTGRLRQAPVWMQEHGLEWLYRFSHEPKRLWRRYLVHGPNFVWNVGLELAGLRKFHQSG
jgi:N-acetylglucosaminyldiphosphoundecaprenol N-acetyl-beta-D-mannosaminyltransferase